MEGESYKPRLNGDPRAAHRRVAVAFTLVRVGFLLIAISRDLDGLGVTASILFITFSIFPSILSGVALFLFLGRSRALAWSMCYSLIDNAVMLLSLRSAEINVTLFVADLVGALTAAVLVYFALDLLARAERIVRRFAIAFLGLLTGALTHSLIGSAVMWDWSRFLHWPDLGWIALKGMTLFLVVQVLRWRASQSVTLDDSAR